MEQEQATAKVSSFSEIARFLMPLVKILKKILMAFVFIFKYASLGLYYILDYIFGNLLLKYLKILLDFIIKLSKKIIAASIEAYHNSKTYQRKLQQLENERNSLMTSVADADKRLQEEVTFRYKAKDATGKIKNGVIRGRSKMDVLSFLTNDGFTVYKIETSKTIDFVFGQSSFIGVKMKTKDIIFWLTQLSTYIKSGIPLTESLKILGKQVGKNKRQLKLFNSLIYELTMGNTFSDAMAKQKGVFPPLLVNMLKAAEATGDLEQTLDEMADYYTELESTRKQMKSAMSYPLIILVFAFGIIIFMVLYIIPQFVGIYAQIGAKLNGLTQFIVDLSTYLKGNITKLILYVIIFVVIFIFLLKKNKFFRRKVQIINMHLPIFGKIIIYNEMTIFTKTFASLLQNNVFITESMDILSKITNNEIYKEIMFKTITNIARGEKISESFKNHWAIPEVAYYMIVTGESTGELASMMNKVSMYYQEEHRTIISTMKSFIEPAMIIFLAVIVGGIIIAVIIPMFSLYGEIG